MNLPIYLALFTITLLKIDCKLQNRLASSDFGSRNVSLTKDSGLRNISTSPPSFLDDEVSVNVSARRGSTVFLQCKVTGLEEQSVSWYRRRGSEIHLITFGFQTYHNDERFSINFEGPDNWRLRIRFVQDRDEGSYECQVSSHPPLIRTTHLHVVVPTIKILDDREAVLREKVFKVGSTIELQCQVSNVPTATSLQLSWYHGLDRLNYDASRGGISVKTELRGSVARSWLRVGDARISDSGLYYCNVTDLSAAGVNIHIVSDEYPAAIQRGNNSSPLHDKILILFTLGLFVICNKLFGPNFHSTSSGG